MKELYSVYGMEPVALLRGYGSRLRVRGEEWSETQGYKNAKRNNTAIRFATAILRRPAEQGWCNFAAATSTAALRDNLNIDGCGIVAPPSRPSRSSRASLLLDTPLSPLVLRT